MCSLFYCLHASFICILVQLLVEYSGYSNKRHIQSRGTYQREALILMCIPKSAALIRGQRKFQIRRLLDKYNIRQGLYTAQKMKFSIKDFVSKCDQICRKLRIWSHLLKKSLMENVIFCAVDHAYSVLQHSQDSLFKHFQGYFRIFRDTDAYSTTLTGSQLGESGEASPALFENRKKCSNF